MMPRHPEVPKRTMSEDYHEGGISDFGFRISDFRPTGQVESPWGGWVENPNSKFRIPYFTFRIPHSTFHIPHSTFHIPTSLKPHRFFFFRNTSLQDL